MSDLRLSALQGVSACMHRVGDRNQIVRTSQSGTEDETTFFMCHDIDRLVPILKYHKFAFANRISTRQNRLQS
jgi:hypothetical protein